MSSPQEEMKMNEEAVARVFEVRADSHDFKEAAIYVFVLAKLSLGKGQKEDAEIYARTCLELLKKCRTDTMEECAHAHINIAGVFIPELFHEGTVRRELAGLNF